MKRLTASRIKLASKCVAWLHEDGPAWGDERPTPAMRFGSALHACIEYTLSSCGLFTVSDVGGVSLEWGLTERQRADLEDFYCSWIAWAKLRPWLFEDFEPEVPFAYDPETGVARHLEKGSHREYRGAKAHEICCTVDGLARVGEHLVVPDWKAFGYRLPAPVDHPQTRTNALIVARAHDAKRITGMLVAIRPDHVWHDSDELGPRRLIETQSELLAIHKRRLAPIEFNPGTHCKDCPALNTCKAHKPKEQANERMG